MAKRSLSHSTLVASREQQHDESIGPRRSKRQKNVFQTMLYDDSENEEGDGDGAFKDKHEGDAEDSHGIGSADTPRSSPTSAVMPGEYQVQEAQADGKDCSLQRSEIIIIPQETAEDQAAESNLVTNQQLAAFREHIEGELAYERDRREELEITVSEMKGRLGMSLSTDKTADYELAQMWKKMDYDINDLIGTLRDNRLKTNKKSLKTLGTRLDLDHGILRDTSPLGLFDLCIRGYLWHFVYHDIFYGKSRHWKSSTMECSQALKKAIAGEEDVEAKRETAVWFFKVHQGSMFRLDEDSQQRIVDMQASILFSLCPSTKSTRIKDVVKNLLATVVKTAVETTRMLMASKALLVADWPADDSTFRPWSKEECVTLNGSEALEGSETDSHRRVVVRPGLVSFGSAEGWGHENSRVVCKPGVFFYEPGQKL